MPRYYFHLLDESTANLVRDSAGTSLPDANEAKREAIGLARDIISHQLRGSTWQVVVTDVNANVVFRVPLSQIRPQRIKTALYWVRSLALYEPRVQPQIFTWLLTAVVIALIMESAMLSSTLRHTPDPIDVRPTDIRHLCRTC
jgi:hypothetical protein